MRTLSKSNSDTLTVIVDLLIPKKGSLPSPSDINVVEHIDDTISDAPQLMRLFVEGLRDINDKDFCHSKRKNKLTYYKNMNVPTAFFLPNLFAIPITDTIRTL